MLDRRIFGHGVTALVSTDLEEAGFLAAFTERTGGVSGAPFESLNLSFSGGDAPDLVLENRRRVCRTLGIERFASGHQVHGSTVRMVGRSEEGAGFDDPSAAFPSTDAMATLVRGVALAVLVADCVPIALASPAEGRLAVVHAGWRGIAAGIVTAAVAMFHRPRELIAAIGPAVGLDHYEVGREVAASVDAAAAGRAVVEDAGGGSRLDLVATAAGVLRACGVPSIEMAEECTACRPDRFYSFRGEGITGRQALVAVRM
ncbi:MAG TPA: polyphenol oxidase family protein [Actinomycetota bacterium]